MRPLFTVGFVLLAASSLRAQLELSPSAVDFGDRGHSERPSQTVVVKNTGKNPVSVRQIKASCGCIEVSPQAILEPIQPGDSRKVAISMGSGRAMGDLDKHVEFLTDSPRPSTISLPVRMRVFPGFSMEPREARFDDGVVGGQSITRNIDITWRGRQGTPKAFELKVEGAQDAGKAGRINPNFSAKVVDIPNGKRIELTLLPTHPEGHIWANLQARLDGKLLEVPVAGEMFRWIKVVPTYFNFSRVGADDPDSFFEQVTLTATDGRKFKIQSFTPTFKGYSMKDIRLEVDVKGGKLGDEAVEHVLRARIVPPPQILEGPKGGAKTGGSTEGSFSGTVTVKTSHPEKPEIQLNFFGFFATPAKK